MVATDLPRAIVGVDESLPGLRALRCAVEAARRRRGALVAVRAWWVTPTWPFRLSPRSWWEGMSQETLAYIVRAFSAAMTGQPGDVALNMAAPEGAPGPELVRLAEREDDLLVIGSRQPTLLGRILRNHRVALLATRELSGARRTATHMAKTGTTRAVSQKLVGEARRLVDLSTPGDGRCG